MRIALRFARRRTPVGRYVLSSLTTLAAVLGGAWLTARTLRQRRAREDADARLDATIEDSFPASDPRALGSCRPSRDSI